MGASVSLRYSESFPKIAYNACRSHGCTGKELAKLFDVNAKTIYEWAKKYPAFRIAVRKGKDEFDCDKVESKLLQRALGWEKEYEDETVTVKEGTDRDGNAIADKTTTTMKKTMICPPDTRALIHWLGNRRAKRWDKGISVPSTNSNLQIDAKKGSNVQVNIQKLSEEQLESLADIQTKFLNEEETVMEACVG